MTQFVLAIIISIVVLVFLIVKLNVHPVISLFVGGMLCGSILGNSPLTTITTIAQRLRFHSGSIGMTIIFGSIIACSIRDSGAAKSMVQSSSSSCSVARTWSCPPVWLLHHVHPRFR